MNNPFPFDPLPLVGLLISTIRVFEYAHKQEIKKVRDEGTWGATQLETIVHPNEYFKRSYLLKNMGNNPVDNDGSNTDDRMEG